MTKIYTGLVMVGLLFLSGCVGSMTYKNEYLSGNSPKAAYKSVAINTQGFFADQLALSLNKAMASQGLVQGKADLSVTVSSRVRVYSRKEGWFKRQSRPLVTTLTARVVRQSDQEVIYSLVKQYQVLIDKKRGDVHSDGWVDKAAAELASEIARNVLPN